MIVTNFYKALSGTIFSVRLDTDRIVFFFYPPLCNTLILWSDSNFARWKVPSHTVNYNIAIFPEI